MMTQANDKVTRAEMKDALLRSGYLLELRVESKLREFCGYAEANATYPDPETGKSREFDLFGLTAHKAGVSDYDYIFGALLVECINNPQPLVILTKEPIVGFLHHQEVKMAGIPVKIPNEKWHSGWEQLSNYLGMENYHHYCKGRVGTQYCSFVKKKNSDKKLPDEWMAIHEGSHYDSFRKLCDVTDYYVDKHFKSWRPGGREYLNVEFYYPLIIVQGDLLEAYETKRSVMFRAVDHIQFRQSVSTNRNAANYQIDVIREKYLPEYLEIIDAELKKTARLLRRRHKTVRLAIDRISEEAKDTESPEQIRKIMDYDH